MGVYISSKVPMSMRYSFPSGSCGKKVHSLVCNHYTNMAALCIAGSHSGVQLMKLDVLISENSLYIYFTPVF